MEKRKKDRRNIENEQQSYLEITLPYPQGLILKKNILDLSDSGLSFNLSKEEGYFLPGTPLKDIKIFSDGKKTAEIEYSEVVYASEMKGNEGSYKIGLVFKKLHKDYSSHKRNLRVFEKKRNREEKN